MIKITLTGIWCIFSTLCLHVCTCMCVCVFCGLVIVWVCKLCIPMLRPEQDFGCITYYLDTESLTEPEASKLPRSTCLHLSVLGL